MPGVPAAGDGPVWRPAAGVRDPTAGRGPAVTTPRQDPRWLRRWWPLFLVAAGLAFAVPETVAIVAGGEGGTMSEWTRDQLGTEGGAVTAGWVALTVLLAGFAVWMPVHLLKGWPWERRRDE